ncbi:MAG: sulfite exporter TauE/SafE family protein [Dehalococcoidaceae bacterium]|nr:sulfite exporter TauE/SafE family protein [Dehalococcoidaceae bacterium]
MDLGGIAEGSTIPVLSAMLLGLVTAISPCPMATNVAAIGYISRRISERKYAVSAGAVYTVGRMFSYTVLGMLIILAGLEIPGVSAFLQDTGERVLGPILIVVGLVMLNIDRISFGAGFGGLSAIGGKVADWGLIGGFLLGVVFALAFCPYSAVLYFGVLIPLSFNSTAGIALPAVFAVGTGLPVLIIGTLLSFGIAGITSWMNIINRAQKVMRIIVSIIFIGVGVYYVITWLQA